TAGGGGAAAGGRGKVQPDHPQGGGGALPGAGSAAFAVSVAHHQGQRQPGGAGEKEPAGTWLQQTAGGAPGAGDRDRKTRVYRSVYWSYQGFLFEDVEGFRLTDLCWARF